MVQRAILVNFDQTSMEKMHPSFSAFALYFRDCVKNTDIGNTAVFRTPASGVPPSPRNNNALVPLKKPSTPKTE